MESRSRPRPKARPRVVVVGGRRTLAVDEHWWPLLDALRRHQRFDQVWHGARGAADHGVARWARARGLPVVEFPAPVELYRVAAQSVEQAEARRNDDMLRAWGGYRKRGGAIVPCARAGGFVDLVLALAPDADTRDLVAQAQRWPSLPIIRMWPPRISWRVRGVGIDAQLVTLGDVVVEADPPLHWTLGRTRTQLRLQFARRGWTARTGRSFAAAAGPRQAG